MIHRLAQIMASTRSSITGSHRFYHGEMFREGSSLFEVTFHAFFELCFSACNLFKGILMIALKTRAVSGYCPYRSQHSRNEF